MKYLPVFWWLVNEVVDEESLAQAVCKLEALTVTSRSTLSALQENTIYRRIAETRQEDMVLKYLDLRRTSTKMKDVDAQLQAEAVVKLTEYRNTVYHHQATEILNKILDTDNPRLQKLLLVVRESDSLAGKFDYCTEKMASIEAKLRKLKVVNEL